MTVHHDNNQAAWFLQHYGMAMNIAFSYAPNRDAVQDIVQSAFIEFVREADPQATDLERTAVLQRVTRRVAQRIWNNHYRDKPEKMRQIATYLSSLSERNFAEKDFEFEHLALQSCLSKLPEKSRKLVEEHYFMGNSVKSISSRFDVSSAAVYKTMALIRDKLRDCIHSTLKKEDRRAEGIR